MGTETTHFGMSHVLKGAFATPSASCLLKADRNPPHHAEIGLYGIARLCQRDTIRTNTRGNAIALPERFALFGQFIGQPSQGVEGMA